jgi:hypothetical protein
MVVEEQVNPFGAAGVDTEVDPIGLNERSQRTGTSRILFDHGVILAVISTERGSAIVAAAHDDGDGVEEQSGTPWDGHPVRPV